jgi:hypothetical protein
VSASFYAPAPETPRDDVRADYLRFLEQRDDDLSGTDGFSKREAWMRASEQWTVRHRGAIDPALFARNVVRFDGSTRPSVPMLALLAFVKVNAGEAYGVEVIGRIRHAQPPGSDLFERVERILAREEAYPTRTPAGGKDKQMPSAKSRFLELFLTRAVRLYELVDRTRLMRSDRPSTPETPAITAA